MIRAMNELLAVDVVLLPPRVVMDNIVNLMDYSSVSPIRLNTHDCLPHISLAMGVLAKADLDKAKLALVSLAAKQKVLPITITETNTHSTPDGLSMRELLISRNEELLQLHQETINTFRSLLRHDNVLINMFVSPPVVADISTHWVKHYYDKRKPADYKPHITLGLGKVTELEQPVNFVAERLALCHLGTYCTCRRILLETSLG